MLTDLLHRVVANPVVYDAVQNLAGTALLGRRAAAIIGPLPAGAVILDVGGGTGLSMSTWPAGATYVCLDIDPVKLAGFRHSNRPGAPVCGDATHLPVRGASVDLLVCKLVSHHLRDGELAMLFKESRRVLKPGGRMLFIDAVYAPERWRSRVLWRYDRGSHPRSGDVLRGAMAAEFQVTDWDELTIQHRYVLGAGAPLGSGG
jgi:ubiquinone/menaquinone biosynthesis C-methylase UbiE